MSTVKSVKHENPYRDGSQYASGFAYIQKNQIVTRSGLVSLLQKKFDLGESAAMATATVLLSPREKNSKRGDCRGNLSAMGHLYFVAPLKKIKGEEKKFRLRWRAKAMEKRDYERPSTIAKAKEIKQEKTAKTKAPDKITEIVTA